MCSPAAVAPPAEQCELGCGGGEGAGKGLGSIAPDLQRLAFRYAAQVAPTAHRAGNQMRRLKVRMWTERTEPGHRRENRGRIPPLQRLVADSLGIQGLDRFPSDDDVELLDQSPELLAPVRRRDIQHDAALAGVEEKERGAGFAHGRRILGPRRERPEGAAVVAGDRAFDLHHVGAKVGEQLGAKRTGNAFGDVEDTSPGKGLSAVFVRHGTNVRHQGEVVNLSHLLRGRAVECRACLKSGRMSRRTQPLQ